MKPNFKVVQNPTSVELVATRKVSTVTLVDPGRRAACRLGDEAAGVRVAAAEGVGQLASRLDGGARAALRARLEDPDLGVRTAAEQALQRLA